MSLNRLKARTQSAHKLGVFVLKGHELKFHKIGRDGSAKCNACCTDSEPGIVEGVVFEIDASEVANLDRAEGLGNGYEKKNVQVINDQGEVVDVFSYFATRTDDSLRPFSWYKRHVLVGAKSAGLSNDYISKIQSVKVIKDPDSSRERRELLIYG